MNHLASFRVSCTGAFAASVLALAAWAQPASAQYNVFSTNFDNYATANTLSGQNGWTTNDLYTGSSYNNPTLGTQDIGESNTVSPGNTGNQATLGYSQGAAGGAVPGAPTSYLYQPFSLGAAGTMQFNVDYIVSASTTGGRDTFGFAFRSAGNTSLFGVNFVPSGDTTRDNVTVNYGGGTFNSDASFALGSRYHLTVNVTLLTATSGFFSAALQPQTSAGANSGAVVSIANGLAFSGGAIGQVAAYWTLANQTPGTASTSAGTNNTPYPNGGNNALAFDNYAVTVPEPSTWAMLGAGVIGLLAVARRRSARLA